MSTNPKSIYNEFIRANLPVGITYDKVRAQYVTGNGKRFPTYLQAKWYLDYIIKFGYSPVFSVASLFSDGEQGVWYDPSDLTTLFQDTAGTTPVTTAGQTVALMLDKSQGLTLGSEEITNGTFDTATDWIARTGSLRIFGGELNLLVGDRIYQPFDVNGLVFNVIALDVQGTTVGVYAGISILGGGKAVSWSVEIISVATSGRLQMFFLASGEIEFKLIGTGADINIDNVSVKELPGYHATQATAAARPEYLLDGNDLPYLLDDEVDDALPATIPDLGTDATLAYATDAGTTILTGQTIGAGSFEALRGVRTYAVIAVDRALTAAETTNVTAYLDAKRGAA